MNLLNEAGESKFLTGKWNIVNDAENEIIYNAKVFKSNFCDFKDAYILVRGDINITKGPATEASFESCAPVTKCITNDGTTIDVEDLDLVMPMYNLIEDSSNYSEATGS